jgi:hypothetical protein
MPTSLHIQQQALVDALFAARHDDAIAVATEAGVLQTGPSWQRGLVAYRSNGQALAQRALAAACPVVAALLGEDNFAALARELWVTDPPARGDIAHWGGSLASLIEQLPDLHRAEPYLADVARLEWAMHRAATQPDGAPDPASFALLTQRDPADVTLRLAPGTQCLASPHPIASIVLAHGGAQVTLEAAGERLRAGEAETALVWRRGLAPCLRIAQPGEREFIAALQESRPLADSLRRAPQLDFGAWLAPAAQEQLLLGAIPL